MALTQEEARRIDIEIAEKVMGLPVSLPGSVGREKDIYDLQRSGLLKPYNTEAVISAPGIIDIPHYSTNISAAWEVVEKLGGTFEIEREAGIPVSWKVYLIPSSAFWKNGLPQEVRAEAPTAPHAISLAAIKVLS